MAGKSIETQYWDTCIFYALYKGEESHGPGVLDAIKASYREFQAGRLNIVTSSITLAEVVISNMGREQYETLKNLRFAPNFQFAQVTSSVVDAAAEIRDYYLRHPLPDTKDGMTVGMGDSIHVATAILRGADVLVTTDCKNKNSKAELGLTKLSGEIAESYYMPIRLPIAPPQLEIDYEQTEEARP